MNLSRFITITFVMLVSSVFFSSCVSRKEIVYFANSSEVAPTAITEITTIRLQPNDEITIRVNAPEQNAAQPFNLTQSLGGGEGDMQAANVELETYIIENDGSIQFPFLGRLKVSGYTIVELARFLEQKIAPYVKDPLVTVRLQNFQFSVLGDVGGPGTYTNPGTQLSLPQALGLAGDLLITGKRTNILIMRQEENKMTYNYVDLTDASITQSPYYYLQQNDVIYVEPNAGQRQRGGLLNTITSYLGVASILISLAVIFTR